MVTQIRARQRRRSLPIWLPLLVVLGLACTGVEAQPPEPSPTPRPTVLEQYQLDPNETRARFEVKFMGFITVRGKFNRTTGTLSRDPMLRNSSIHAIIDATTLEAITANARTTNRVLRGREFFHVDKFPTIAFTSTRFEYEGERLLRINGTLTMLGIARPVSLLVAAAHCAPAEGERKARCEADAAVTIRRSDFGMSAWNESVADEVKIIVELVAIEALRDAAPVKAGAASAILGNGTHGIKSTP